ncbi:MAG: Fur family transcriptional regulator [Formivibrio sp.]|nr:Fur family transcriptional regulator [Formivibrio sp.]
MSTHITQARKLIEAVQAKATLARLSVLSVLIEANRPLSHQEVLQLITPPLDRVTAYRVFDWLEMVGIVHRINTDDRVTRFSISRVPHCHVHFQCEQCGRIFCLDQDPVLPSALPDGFVMRTVEMTVKGMCADCTHTPLVA